MADTGSCDIRVYTTRPSYGTRPSFMRFKVLIMMLIKKMKHSGMLCPNERQLVTEVSADYTGFIFRFKPCSCAASP